MKKLSNKEKKRRVKALYTLDELCEILGYYDQSNPDLDFSILNHLKENNMDAFELMIVDYAIKNGNFEETINDNVRVAL